MDNTENEQFEVTILGKKFTATMLAIYGTIASTVIGVLWAGFQVWHKIDSYVAPDIEGIEKRLVILEESTAKVNDYTRDIKDDLKTEIRALDNEVKAIRSDARAMQKEARDDIRDIRRDVDVKIKRALDNPLANKE
jgi:cell division protein ZapA (FtsZ GTPase activity inhibitor)